MKTSRLNIRFSEDDLTALETVSAALGLDASNTLRFLLHEKARELGNAAAPHPAKKKRRPSA